MATGAVACREQVPEGAGSRIILSGPNGTIVQLTSSNGATVADTFAFDVTVLHRIVQSLGTTNGTTALPAQQRGDLRVLGEGVGEVKYPDGWTTLTPRQPPSGRGMGRRDPRRGAQRVRHGHRRLVTWTSSNTSVVTVVPIARDYGSIHGVAAGTAWVHAVRVAAPTVQHDSVQVTVVP